MAELLRTYNIVNSRSGSRYTIRFAALFLAAAVGIVAAVALLPGGPPEAGRPAANVAEDEDDDRAPSDAASPEIAVVETHDGYYIGYPLDAYQRALNDHYDEGAVNDALLTWLSEHPDLAPIGPPEPVHAANDDGILLGYLVKLR